MFVPEVNRLIKDEWEHYTHQLGLSSDGPLILLVSMSEHVRFFVRYKGMFQGEVWAEHLGANGCGLEIDEKYYSASDWYEYHLKDTFTPADWAGGVNILMTPEIPSTGMAFVLGGGLGYYDGTLHERVKEDSRDGSTRHMLDEHWKFKGNTIGVNMLLGASFVISRSTVRVHSPAHGRGNTRRCCLFCSEELNDAD